MLWNNVPSSGWLLSLRQHKENQNYSKPNIFPVIASIRTFLTTGGMPVDTVTNHVLPLDTAFLTTMLDCCCPKNFSANCFTVSLSILNTPYDITAFVKIGFVLQSYGISIRILS